VKVGAPIIGGLAFATDRFRETSKYSEQGTELMSLAVIERLLPEGGVVVDVGAGIGVFTVAAARCVGERGHVVAFEPRTRKRDLLTINLNRHRVGERVEVRSECVGAAQTTRVFPRYEDALASGQNVDVAPPWPWPDVPAEDDVPLEVITVFEAIESPVDMVKVNVERFDAEVLKGAVELVNRSPRAVLLVEFSALQEAARRTLNELLQLLPSGEWCLFLIDKESNELADALAPLDRTRSANSVGVDLALSSSLLATRETRAPDLRAPAQ
jgi:FkbM family methyltransferase